MITGISKPFDYCSKLEFVFFESLCHVQRFFCTGFGFAFTNEQFFANTEKIRSGLGKTPCTLGEGIYRFGKIFFAKNIMA
jgi:hypothetical protein